MGGSYACPSQHFSSCVDIKIIANPADKAIYSSNPVVPIPYLIIRKHSYVHGILIHKVIFIIVYLTHINIKRMHQSTVLS